MAAGRPKSIDNNKIFDVSKPGKSKPMGTSRPVIISRGNIITDPSDISAPMAPPSASRKIISPVSVSPVPEPEASAVAVKVNGATKPLEESMTEASASTPVSIEVKNTAPTVEPDKVEPAAAEEPKPAADGSVPALAESVPATDEATSESAADAPETEAEKAPDTEEEAVVESDPSEEAPATSDAASVDALAESTTKKKEEEKQLEEQAKREAELQALIDSGKYFVPLDHDSSAKKSSKGVWIVLVIILLVGAAYVVIDAKVVKTSISLPYHLFKQ